MFSSRWFVVVFVFAFALAVGCNKDQSSPSPGPGPGPRPGPGAGPEATGPHAEGIKVFNQKCGNCHSVSGAKKRAPDLGKIAADPTHTEEWLREFVLDPGAHMKPKMPSMQGKISDDEMKALLAYLVTLK